VYWRVCRKWFGGRSEGDIDEEEEGRGEADSEEGG